MRNLTDSPEFMRIINHEFYNYCDRRFERTSQMCADYNFKQKCHEMIKEPYLKIVDWPEKRYSTAFWATAALLSGADREKLIAILLLLYAKVTR